MNKVILVSLALAITLFTSCSKEEQETLKLDETHSNLVAPIQGPKQVIPGEYIVVFKEESNTQLQYDLSESTSDTEIARIKSYFFEKAESILATTHKNKDDIGYVFTGIFQGFVAKNISSLEVTQLRQHQAISEIIPNYSYEHSEKQNPSVENEMMSYTQIPEGDWIHHSMLDFGYRDMSSSSKSIFFISTGIRRRGFAQLNLRTSLAYSSVPNSPWYEARYDDFGSGIAVIMAGKINGKLGVGIAAGAPVVPVKVQDGYNPTVLSRLLQGLDYTFTKVTYGDVFVYALHGSISQQPSHPIIVTSLSRIESKTFGAIGVVNAATPISTAGRWPSNIRGHRSWAAGIANSDYIPISNASYGYNIDTWAPSRNMRARYTEMVDIGYDYSPALASAITGSVLFINGNNTIDTNGTTTYYGYQAPNLSLD